MPAEYATIKGELVAGVNVNKSDKNYPCRMPDELQQAYTQLIDALAIGCCAETEGCTNMDNCIQVFSVIPRLLDEQSFKNHWPRIIEVTKYGRG